MKHLPYLLIILGLIFFNMYTIWWFDGHYTELDRQLKAVKTMCLEHGIDTGPDL